MICELCKRRVRTKKNIHNLFDQEIHHICESCYDDQPLNRRFQVIPIQNGVIYYQLLLADHVPKEGKAYMSFLAPFYFNYLTEFSDTIIIYVDQTDEELFSILEFLKLGNIYLLSLYENIEKGE